MAKKASPKSMTKTEVLNALAEKSGVNKKEVASVIDALAELIESQIGKKGPGVFSVPGLMKITVQRKPATKAKKGVPNPFRPGELMDVAAKPAKNVVKIRPLKNLKDMV